MRGVVGPRVRTGRCASHIDFRSARGLSEAEEGHGPEDARLGLHGETTDVTHTATSLAGAVGREEHDNRSDDRRTVV